MKPNGYQITEPAPGFAAGDILNVTARFGYRNEMELELISASPGSKRVVVTDEPTGFSERNVLDPTARFGDWQRFSRTFAAGDDTVIDGTAGDGHVCITPATLSAIAEPMDA
jgi:hypothetical protein